MIVQKSKRLRKGGEGDIRGDLKQGEGERSMPEKLTAVDVGNGEMEKRQRRERAAKEGRKARNKKAKILQKFDN